MLGLITYVFILGFVLPCLFLSQNVKTQNNKFDVMQYGAYGDGKSDDSNAFLKAWDSACQGKGETTLVIPQGKTFMVMQYLVFDGKSCQAQNINIQLQGKIVAPSKDELKAGEHWITIRHVTKSKLTIDGNGEIDGNGNTWWQCKNCQRPGALYFNTCNDLTVRNLRISNSPKAHISMDTIKGATFSNISINSPSNSPNTDGFDIADSTNIVIEDSIIKAGDDCVAVNGGSSFVNVTRVVCGPGHGISIGSLGKDNSEGVEDVYVTNCTLIETTNGARVKTVPGGAGYAKRITFEQIQLINVKNPIVIDQFYNSDESAVEVSGVTYRGFNGTSSSAVAINFNCCSLGCFDIELDQVNIISSQPGKQTIAFCRNVHGIAKSTIPPVSCIIS